MKTHPQIQTERWYARAGSSPHHQGHIASEITGKTIAVTYSDENGTNATLLAAAPEMKGMLADGALQLGRLTGPQLKAYARTFAALAERLIYNINNP